MRRRRPESENPDLLEQDGVSGGIEELPARVNRYGEAKKSALDVAEYMATMPKAQGLERYAQLVKTCGDYLVFRHYFTVNQVKLHGASLCRKHLLCPLCAIRRGAKSLKAYLDRFELIKAEKPHLRPFHA